MPITSGWFNPPATVAETMLKSPTLCFTEFPLRLHVFVFHILKGTYTLLLLNTSSCLVPFLFLKPTLVLIYFFIMMAFVIYFSKLVLLSCIFTTKISQGQHSWVVTFHAV